MLRQIRIEMGYSIQEMADALGLKKATYQCYEECRRRDPEGLHALMLYLQEIDRRFMAELPGKLEVKVAKQFPHGFMSAPVREEGWDYEID